MIRSYIPSRLLIIAIAIFFTGFMGCKDPEPVNPTNPEDFLNYDGPNLTAPTLPFGTYEAAARFPVQDLGAYSGKKLTEVQIYIVSIPSSCAINIYKGTDAEKPGELIYSKSVIDDLEANAWHIHTLDTPITSFDDDLWISVAFDHDFSMGSLGCDPGPADEDGDWTFDSLDSEWRSLRSRTNFQININWNIRGKVEDN